MGCTISRTQAEYDMFKIVGFPLQNGAIRIEEIMDANFAYSGNPVILGCRSVANGERLFYGGERLPNLSNSVILQCDDNGLTSSIHENDGIFAPVGAFIGDFTSLDDFECKVPN